VTGERVRERQDDQQRIDPDQVAGDAIRCWLRGAVVVEGDGEVEVSAQEIAKVVGDITGLRLSLQWHYCLGCP
jgi:hypothetical protein